MNRTGEKKKGLFVGRHFVEGHSLLDSTFYRRENPIKNIFASNEGRPPTVQSLLSRNYVHHVGPNEL